MKSTSALMLPDESAKAIATLALTRYSFANGTATTATVAEIPFAVVPKACDVSSVYFVGGTTVTPASGSNTCTITITAYDGAGGTGTTVAVGTIANATSATQYQKLALTNGYTTLTAGTVLTFKTAVVGTATLPVGVAAVEAVIRSEN